MAPFEKTLNEGSTARVLLTFLTVTGAQEAPTQFVWRIDTEAGLPVVAPTTESSPEAQHELYLTPNQVAIQDTDLQVEGHILTVMATYGATDGVNSTYRYGVRNLLQVS